MAAADGGDRGVCLFSIHFGLCGASGVGKWGRAAFRGGKAAFLSLLRDHVCLWMPGSLPEAGISVKAREILSGLAALAKK